LVTCSSDVVVFLKSFETDLLIGLILIANGVEYRSIVRSLSGWGHKGETNTPIAAKNEITDLLRWLKLNWRSGLSMIAIRVEPEYRFVGRSLSEWGPKGEPNAPIAAKSEVVDFLRQRCSYICSSDLL
jgi:hypothetical protein